MERILKAGTKVKAKDGRQFTIVSPVMFIPPQYMVEFDDEPGELRLISLKIPSLPAIPDKVLPRELRILAEAVYWRFKRAMPWETMDDCLQSILKSVEYDNLASDQQATVLREVRKQYGISD